MRSGMSSGELESLFDCNVDEGFQRATLDLLKHVYVQSLKDVRAKFGWPEDVIMWGHERRAQFDRDWRELAERFAPDVLGTSESNSNGSFYFTRIVSGKAVLTASCATEMETIRQADYRDTLARSSQGKLFEDDDAVDESDKLYAILIHRPSEEEKWRPQFAKFVFPVAEGGFHEFKIDLLERFEFGSTDVLEEEIPDDVFPELKKDDDERNAEEA